MPRKARLNVPGTVCHIMSRCLRSEVLFRDDNDRASFLALLGKHLAANDYRCYAWVLMNNHYHIVVRTSSQDLWRLMKPLNTGYARYHKIKYERNGPLFLDRYKSIVTQDQNYIQELVRYVHLNPVRAGICANLEELAAYPWSGHCDLMGNARRAFHDTASVLRRFGVSTVQARRQYCAFLEAGLAQDDSENMLVRLVRDSNDGCEAGRAVRCWAIGDPSFVQKVISESEAKRLRISRFEREGRDLDVIAKKVGAHFGVSNKRFRFRCRGGRESEARKVFVHTAVDEYGAPSKLVALYCGVSQAAVSALAKAGREIAHQRLII